MAKYRKKPKEVEAVQWLGNTEFIPVALQDNLREPATGIWDLLTREGWTRLELNDWIVWDIGIPEWPWINSPEYFLTNNDPVE